MGFNTLKQSTEILTGIKKKMSISRDALENMHHTVDPLNFIIYLLTALKAAK